MTRNVKLCISLLLALFLTLSLAVGVLADPEDPADTPSEGGDPTEGSEGNDDPSEGSSESSEDSSDPSEGSTGEPSNMCTVTVLGDNVLVYFDGSTSPATQKTVEVGGSVTFIVEPVDGHQVQSVTMSGVPVPLRDNGYELTDLQNDCTVRVTTVPDGSVSDPSDPSDPPVPSDVPLWNVEVTVRGSGSVTVYGTVTESEEGWTIDQTVISAPGTQTVKVRDTDLSGEKVRFVLQSAEGYRLGKIAIDGNENYQLLSDFRSQVTEDTRVEITFVPEEDMPSTFPVSVTVLTSGGYVTVNGQEVHYGPVTTFDITAGGALNLWVYSEAGYELDKLIVDGNSENIASGSFTLQSVAKEMRIEVSFKEKVDAKPVQPSDLDWMPKSDNCIHLTLTADVTITKAVFDKINTLSAADGDYVILETEYIRWYIPCGGRIENVTDDYALNITVDTGAADYAKVSAALQKEDAYGPDVIFNFYQLASELSFPEGTKVAFNMRELGISHSGHPVELLVREAGNMNTVGKGVIGEDRWTDPMAFRNTTQMAVIVLPKEDQPDISVSIPEFSDPSEEEPAGRSYAGLIVALVIAFVAVGGAATLFIVKWRQEKF